MWDTLGKVSKSVNFSISSNKGNKRKKPTPAGKMSELKLKAHIPRSEPPFQQKEKKKKNQHHLHFSLLVWVVK